MSLLRLMKTNNMMREVHQASLRMEKIFKECLKADDEEVIIITDSGRDGSRMSAVLAAGYFFAARSLDLGTRVHMQSQKSKGERTEEHIEAMLDDTGYKNIIIMATNALGSIPGLGSGFRKFARSRKHKFITCTGLASLNDRQLGSVLNTIDIDYSQLWRNSLPLKDALDNGNEVNVTTPAGTDL